VTPPADESAWTRLGRLLADRRIQLAARYRNKTLFSQERQIHRRMLWAIESGGRDTYTPDTIRVIEAAYEGKCVILSYGPCLTPLLTDRPSKILMRPSRRASCSYMHRSSQIHFQSSFSGAI